jgi:peptide/nickel transport system permease protein
MVIATGDTIVEDAVPAAVTRRSRLPLFLRVLLGRPTRIVACVILLLFILLAIVGPYLYSGNLPVDPDALFAKPSAKHLLGTDYAGTDVLAEIVLGARYVILSAAVSGVITVVIGTAVGLVAGFYRGVTESALMRVTDFIINLPGLPLLIVLSQLWKFGSPWEMGLVLGITGWGFIARPVRSQTLSLRERSFLEASRALGLPAWHIIVREILPNVAPFVAMNLLLSVVAGVYAQTGLFFLGVVPYTSTNWGVMLNQAIANGALTNTTALSYLLSPILCILLLTLSIVLLLDATDELFNPRLRD